jgi:WD40 repeat protein
MASNQFSYDVKENELSEYEKLCERNIEKRKSLFHELNLRQLKDDAATAAGFVFDNDKKYIASKRGLAAQAKVKEDLPPRKSLRLQGVDADTGVKLPEKEPSRYFQYESYEDNEKHPLRDLELHEILSRKDKEEDINTISSYLAGVVDNLETKKTTPEWFYKSSILTTRLKIKEEQVAKVVPSRIMSLAVNSSTAKLLVAVGDKWGNVGLWDVNDRQAITHGVRCFAPHTGGANCVTFDEHTPTKLNSSSYDGSFRSFDIEKQRSILLYGLQDHEDGYLTQHCLQSPFTYLLAGKLGNGKQAKGMIFVVDTRTSNDKPAHSYTLFPNGGSTKTISVHPIKKELVVATSKQTCMLFDIRSVKEVNSRVMPIQEYIGHTRAISSAFLSPLTGEKLATVAYDNKIRFYEVGGSNKTESPSKSIHHNNQTGRWLSTFQAVWHPRREDLLFIGSMNRPRQIDAISDKGVSYPPLQGEDLGSICSRVVCHPTQDIVVGGNSSGRVHVFR